ncbi:60S ribosomal protein L14 [Tetranychus urticae]|uniref:Large ribosomal subunit protein eL14 n=1 Tax=Tetranychus urticae TaxID=32264 RepID=T1K9F8_TETUR|nr:60S ribosomal protein L14 [Tetranychus urticae]
MGIKPFVQRGRVAYLTCGANYGKLCVIIDIIDQNRALVSGPTTGVRRQPLSFQKMKLTKYILKDVHPTIGDKALSLKLKESDFVDQFNKSKTGQNLKNKEKRTKMTDFDRFKLQKTKQKMNKLISRAAKKISLVSKKAKK